MKPIGIVTDSHCGIAQDEAEQSGIRILPMPFYINGECFYEGVTISREAFFEKMRAGAEVATSQPSPADVMALWDDALAEYEQILYMPLSSGLSGSCATAMALSRNAPYEGRVYVVDHGRVATPLHRTILDAQELIAEGYSASKIKDILEQSRSKMVIYIGVQTLEHLKRGGRITPATASLGTLLNIKPVLKLGVENLDTFKKCRGFHRAKTTMLEAIRHDLDTTFQTACQSKEIYLLAASSGTQKETEEWVAEIQAAFPDLEILCDNLTLGISCHTGEGALGIGLSCRPSRP